MGIDLRDSKHNQVRNGIQLGICCSLWRQANPETQTHARGREMFVNNPLDVEIG